MRPQGDYILSSRIGEAVESEWRAKNGEAGAGESYTWLMFEVVLPRTPASLHTAIMSRPREENQTAVSSVNGSPLFGLPAGPVPE